MKMVIAKIVKEEMLKGDEVQKKIDKSQVEASSVHELPKELEAFGLQFLTSELSMPEGRFSFNIFLLCIICGQGKVPLSEDWSYYA